MTPKAAEKLAATKGWDFWWDGSIKLWTITHKKNMLASARTLSVGALKQLDAEKFVINYLYDESKPRLVGVIVDRVTTSIKEGVEQIDGVSIDSMTGYSYAYVVWRGEPDPYKNNRYTRYWLIDNEGTWELWSMQGAMGQPDKLLFKSKSRKTTLRKVP